MKIIYVHHGERNFGNPPTQDDGLTELGYKDCELVAELLKPIKNKIKAIYSSKFFRCAKTAEIINKNLGLEIYLDSRLDEFDKNKCESFISFQNQVIKLLDEIVEKYNNDDYVICVTSGANINAFICKSYNILPSDKAFIGVPSCSPIVFDYKK